MVRRKRLYRVEVIGVGRSVMHYQDRRWALARARGIAARNPDLRVIVCESFAVEWREDAPIYESDDSGTSDVSS